MSGWDNYDLNPGPNVKKINILESFESYGLVKESVDFMFFCHAIEHFDEVDGLEILKKIKQSMKPTGVVRIVCPSLNTYIKRFLGWDEPWNKTHKEKFRNATHFINYAFYGEHKAGMKFIKGKSSSNLGHRFIYSEEDLIEKLRLVGFTKIEKCAYGKSVHKELNGLDLVRRDFNDLCIEASVG